MHSLGLCYLCSCACLCVVDGMFVCQVLHRNFILYLSF